MKKNNFTYHFREESVTLEIPRPQAIGNSYVSFNCYSLQSRKKFKDFKQELASSKKNQFDNINDIYGLANKHGIRATNGHRPIFVDNIAF